VSKLLALAKAEKRSCPFFDFSLAINTDTITFVVRVPADQETILDEFVRLVANA
jgi:hypothetical protein